MNILFLTLIDFDSLDESNIYTDLLKEFEKNGHDLYIISPVERRRSVRTHMKTDGHVKILKLKIGNIQKTNIVEKGLSTISIEAIMLRGIKKYFGEVKFGLVLYSTPPITLCNAIKYVKKRDDAKTYLLLKDIFPQNALDIGLLRKDGIKGILYKYFRHKEKKLYKLSNYIGCMSRENVRYIKQHNPEIDVPVEVCPNSIIVKDKSIDNSVRNSIRKKYDLPTQKRIFVYGGNLGKPQDILFVISCLKSQKKNNDVFFLIVGDGTEYSSIERYIVEERPKNVRLMRRIPKEDYDNLVASCDVGLIFLDHRFTIPNFPSRMLGYMQAKLPVLAVTDTNTDVGNVITEGEFGWWCESNSTEAFDRCINEIGRCNLKQLGQNAFVYLGNHYSVENAYKIIEQAVNK